MASSYKEKLLPTIQRVTPLPDYRLELEFTSGSMLILNMKHWLTNMRYCPLQDVEIFNSVKTDGARLIFDTHPQFEVKILSDEVLRLALNIPYPIKVRMQNERGEIEATV